MNPTPPEFLQSFLKDLRPPAFLVAEGQRRLLLLLNHVLGQEQEARDRLLRHAGRVLLAQWRGFEWRLVATRAGLLDLAPDGAAHDLRVSLAEDSPLELARGAWRGETPALVIEGDAALATDIGWIAEHVRWDVEQDLSRLIGDAGAYRVAQAGRRLADALRSFAAGAPFERKPGA